MERSRGIRDSYGNGKDRSKGTRRWREMRGKWREWKRFYRGNREGIRRGMISRCSGWKVESSYEGKVRLRKQKVRCVGEHERF